MVRAGDAPPILDFAGTTIHYLRSHHYNYRGLLLIKNEAFYSNDASAKKKLVDDVRSCCLHNGFFQITGHSVPLELQNKIMNWNKRFFDLSLEQKNEVNKGIYFNFSLFSSCPLLCPHVRSL
jgi:hypothetical protein